MPHLTLEELKKLICNANDLGQPMNYFFDMVDGKIIFELPGHRQVESVEQDVELAPVLEVIKLGIKQRLGKNLTIVNSVFYYVPSASFYHGACMSPNFGVPLTVLYFADLNIGIFAVTNAGQNEIFRFNLVKQPARKSMH